MNIERAEIAKKYAQAFLNLSLNSVTHQVLLDLRHLHEYIKHHNKHIILLTVPFLSAKKKQDILWHLFSKFSMPGAFGQLLRVLIAHRCVDLLPDILEHIIIEYKVRNNIEDFAISSSAPLSHAQQEKIISFIQSHVNKVIITRVDINKKLIAGLRIQSETLLWEYSINKHCKIIEKSFGLKDAYGY